MRRSPRHQSGFSLIELMITLLLGLVVVGAASGMFLANKRVYSSTETMGRIQENTRVAFELMSRDLREAGGNPCSSAATTVNQMTSGDNAWWQNVANGMRGYAGDEAVPGLAIGAGTTQRVDGTDAIEVHIARDTNIRVVSHAQPSAVIQVNDPGDIVANDVLVICNMDYVFVFQATGIQDSDKIQHNGGGGSGINCSQEFQHERNCASGASGTKGYCFAPGAGAVNPNCDEFSNTPAYIGRIETVRWYIGNNARGGRSLYRQVITNRSNTETPDVVLATDEIAEGVQDLRLQYLVSGADAYADTTGSWGAVTAVKAELNLAGTTGALAAREVQGTDGEALNRWMSNVVNLRNREATL